MEGYSALILTPCHIAEMLLGYHHPSVPAIQPSSAPVSFFFLLFNFFFFPPGSLQVSAFTVFVCLFVFYSAIWHPVSLLGCTSAVPVFHISCSVVVFILPSTPRHRVTFVLLTSLADVFIWPECSPAPVSFPPNPIWNNASPLQFHPFSWVNWLHCTK